MPILREHIETRLPLDEAFAFVADFANASRWDPGVAWSEPVEPGQPAVGTRYRLGVRVAGRVAPMDYTITRLDPPNRVVLAGEGAGVVATDDIAFQAVDGRTVVSYTADIRLTGVRRLFTPFAGGAFRRIATGAREGLQRALDERAAGRRSGTEAAA
jgi:carbon monoxide dehydrogenase subunit G